MFKVLNALLLLSLSVGLVLTLDICEYQINGTRLSHPADCTKFVVCQNGKTDRIAKCPLGLHYNRFEGLCDLRQRAACEPAFLNFVTEESNCSTCCALYGCVINPECPETPGTPATSTTGTSNTPATPVTGIPTTPDTPETPNTPSTAAIPETQSTAETPNTSKNPSTPETTDTSAIPSIPETPGTSATPDTPFTPATPENTDTPVTPNTPFTPATPDHTDTPATPDTPFTPATPENTESPATPKNPSTPGIPSTSNIPETSSTGKTPNTSENPSTPQTPNTTASPSIPNTPETAATPDATSTPVIPATPQIPGNKCLNNLTNCIDKLDKSVQYLNGTCNEYIVCSGGCAIIMSCPSGLQYNISTQMCDYVQNVDCPWRSTPPTTGPSGIACAQRGKCAEQYNGKMFASSKGTGYIVCQCECEVERPCPAGTKFNEELSTCAHILL